MSLRRRFVNSPRLQVTLAVILSTVILTALSRASDSPVSVETAIENVRANVLGQVGDGQVSSYWSAGSGRTMGMDMTFTMRYDDEGRFVRDGRGVISLGAGFDGTTTWKQTPAGETRILQRADGLVVRLPHWMILGYWAADGAPVSFAESPLKAGRNEMVVSMQAEGAPFVASVYIDTKRWLPKRFVVNDYGVDLAIHCDSWQRSGKRFVPKQVHVTEQGKETESFVIDAFRPDNDVTAAVYEPVDDNLMVVYSADRQGPVETLRGRWGHHFVRPLINGRDIGWLAFDTGAGGTFIDRATARTLGLEFVGESTSTGIGGSAQDKIAIVESLEIGPVRLQNIPVYVRDLNVSLGIADNRGLLGMDVLRHCVIDYDQQGSTIGLYDPATYSLPEDEWAPLYDHNGKPFIAMEYEGHDGLFTIDTGNPGAVIISPHMVERYELLQGRQTRRSTIGGTGGNVDVEKGTLEWVQWGDGRFHDVPADFVLENIGAGADRSRDGIIGTDLLRRYRVVFDMEHGRIAYLPNTTTN